MFFSAMSPHYKAMIKTEIHFFYVHYCTSSVVFRYQDIKSDPYQILKFGQFNALENVI